MNLLEDKSRERIVSVAQAGQGEVASLVVHDQKEAVEPSGYVEALRSLDRVLGRLSNPPRLCIEYAVGLQPSEYLNVMEQASELPYVAACIDIGHVGIAAARRAFAERHPELDVCALTPWEPSLPSLLDDVQEAVARGREVAIELTGEIASMGKGMHLHLHDGHPLSTASEYGVSDHMPFAETVALPFEYEGAWGVETMFGPGGLVRIVRKALSGGYEGVSFTLEIHPSEGRRPLGDAEGLFGHWSDRTNAERMNYWLGVLQGSARLVQGVYSAGGA